MLGFLTTQDMYRILSVRAGMKNDKNEKNTSFDVFNLFENEEYNEEIELIRDKLLL